MTVADAAKFLKVSTRTIRNYLVRAIRPLPHVKPGGRILIDRKELNDWIRN
jgi:excisionase family DNA binding protein